MSLTIWKFHLLVMDEVELRMPAGAKLLDVQVQHGQPCVWAVVDENAVIATRMLAVRGTGHPCDGLSADQYVGTFQLHGGELVFHVFDLGEVADGGAS